MEERNKFKQSLMAPKSEEAFFLLTLKTNEIHETRGLSLPEDRLYSSEVPSIFKFSHLEVWKCSESEILGISSGTSLSSLFRDMVERALTSFTHLANMCPELKKEKTFLFMSAFQGRT